MKHEWDLPINASVALPLAQTTDGKTQVDDLMRTVGLAAFVSGAALQLVLPSVPRFRRVTRGRWWYKLSHVCQRWRTVILGSPSYLGVSLVCTFGTPVADVLAHSPPLPLVIEYRNKNDDISAEDEEGAILSLKQYSRVRLVMRVTSLQKLIVAMDDEYPILEHLIISRPLEDESSISQIPETLQVPHLHHLALEGFALPIGFRLLTTAVGLVTLCLGTVHPSTYFHPNIMLRWLSFMPQLETLLVTF